MTLNLAPVENVLLDHHGKCPNCGTNWDGGSIFDVLREQDWCKEKSAAELQAHIDDCYGTDRPQRFSRIVGISCYERDRVIVWQCPDCNKSWPR